MFFAMINLYSDSYDCGIKHFRLDHIVMSFKRKQIFIFLIGVFKNILFYKGTHYLITCYILITLKVLYVQTEIVLLFLTTNVIIKLQCFALNPVFDNKQQYVNKLKH